MKFPANYPDFNDADRRELQSLGVTDAQVIRLRLALGFVQAIADPKSYASRAAIAEILSDVEKLSGDLWKKLGSLVTKPTIAHRATSAMIEQGYWSNPERSSDEGFCMPVHMMPRLQALALAAKVAKAALPTAQARHRTADPNPVRHIREALRNGWRDTHGSSVTRTPHNRTRSVEAAPRPPPYPKALRPSKADGSRFRRIVGICYRTVGANPDPLRAIENYLAQENRERRKAIAALEKGIAEADRKANDET